MEVFLGTVMPVGFNFAPYQWTFCHGQLLAISQNAALFALIGTNFGGNGEWNFALPDLRGRSPIGLQNGVPGVQTGTESVTLTIEQAPSHNHIINATTTTGTGRGTKPNGMIFADDGAGKQIFTPPSTSQTTLSASTNVTKFVGGQSHNNLQPYLTVNYIIAMSGNFPSRE
jgi:microcystin-dependent protein